MKIDTHQHVFWHGRDDKGLIADMDQHGIGQAWLLTWEIPIDYPEALQFSGILNPARARSDGTSPGIVLEDLLLAHRNHPGRFVLGYCPDPAKPNAPALFEAACEMHGVRVCGEWKFRMLIDDPRSVELFRTAGRLKAPVVIHLDSPYLPPHGGRYFPNWYGGTIENFERAIQACPDTTFVGHAPGFWRYLSGDADTSADQYPKGLRLSGGKIEKLLDTYPNLMVDLSAGSALIALKRDIAFCYDFMCRYFERVLFARDYYGAELLAFLKELNLPEEVQRHIFSENASRLLEGAQSRPSRSEMKLS